MNYLNLQVCRATQRCQMRCLNEFVANTLEVRPRQFNVRTGFMSASSVSFLAVGDVFIERSTPSDAFRHYQGLIRAADISFCNLEGPCSDLGTPTIGKLITIRMKPAVIAALAELEF